MVSFDVERNRRASLSWPNPNVFVGSDFVDLPVG
jgi:hypothetical protein